MKFAHTFLIVVFLLLFSGCGNMGNTPETEVRAAEDAPAAFFPEQGVIQDGTTCKSPMVDNRNGTKLLMIRSFGDGRGDYEVPEGRYGVRRGELLRINCRTGEILGIVRR